MKHVLTIGLGVYLAFFHAFYEAQVAYVPELTFWGAIAYIGILAAGYWFYTRKALIALMVFASLAWLIWVAAPNLEVATLAQEFKLTQEMVVSSIWIFTSLGAAAGYSVCFLLAWLRHQEGRLF